MSLHISSHHGTGDDGKDDWSRIVYTDSHTALEVQHMLKPAHRLPTLEEGLKRTRTSSAQGRCLTTTLASFAELPGGRRVVTFRWLAINGQMSIRFPDDLIHWRVWLTWRPCNATCSNVPLAKHFLTCSRCDGSYARCTPRWEAATSL